MALVVNRDVNEMRLLRAALEKLGYQVFLAVNSHQAVSLYQEHASTTAVVVLGTGQTGLDSTAALRALQSVDPNVRHCFICNEIEDAPPQPKTVEPAIHRPFYLPAIRATLCQLLDE